MRKIRWKDCGIGKDTDAHLEGLLTRAEVQPYDLACEHIGRVNSTRFTLKHFAKQLELASRESESRHARLVVLDYD